MELITKQGYKQTEIGLIPEDWEVKMFEQLGRFLKGKGIKKDEVRPDGNPCVRYGELYTQYDNIIKETVSFINDDVAEESIKLKFGDLLFAGSGETKEDIGKSAVIIRDDTYAGGDIVIFRANNIDPVFLGFMSNSIPVNKQKALNGQGDAVVHIYSSGISKIKIPLPPTLEEQKAIATALSDVDNLISNLDQLIAKKKAIKQGAMQQLLTPPSKGGKRLDGFDGEWVEKKLGDIAEIATGTTPPTRDLDNYGNEFCFVSPADLGKGKYISKTIKNLSVKGFAISRIFPKDSIMVTCIGSTIGKIGIASVKLTSNQQINAVFPNETFISEYIYYQLSLMINKIKLMASEQAVPMINKSEFSEIIVFLPEKKEQKAIAIILSDLDKELEKLETKKEKYQYIKQGMMQELLTGKTRLV